MDNEKVNIEKCRQRIEEKIGWGSSAEWQNQDFEALSERIFRETKVSLSASTLKRLWGKIRYEGTPNISTLNALAQFIGYENWRAFTSKGITRQASNGSEPKYSRQYTFSSLAKVILTIIVALCTAFLIWAIQKRPKQLEYKNIVFNSEPVTNTVPNTIVFHYNAKDSNADSVFIQQSWDPGAPLSRG